MKTSTRLFLGFAVMSVITLLTWQTLFAQNSICPQGYVWSIYHGICVPADVPVTGPEEITEDWASLTCTHGFDCLVITRRANCLELGVPYAHCYPRSETYYSGCNQSHDPNIIW